MRATFKTLNVALLAMLALPLAAQDTAPTQEATPDPAAPEAVPEAPTAQVPAAELAPAAEPAPAATDPAEDGAAPGGDLAIGQPADGQPTGAEPQVGEPYIRESFGAWGQRCIRAEEGPDPCQLYQLLEDDQGNAVAEISMFPLPEGGEAVAGATIVTPLETLLTANLTLSVDAASTRSYPFTFCNAAGCIARVGFTAEEIEQFKRGNEATVRLVPAAAPDQEVILTLSLSGFTAGYDAQQTPPVE